MAAIYRKYTLWDYTTGDCPGAMRNALRHLTEGVVYVVYPKNTVGLLQVKAVLSSGAGIAIDQKNEVTANNMKAQYLGVQPDMSHAYYFQSQNGGTTGVASIQAEGVVMTDDKGYNPLDFAVLTCYPSTGSALVVNSNSYKSLIKENPLESWPSPQVYIEPTSKALKLTPSESGRLVHISLQGDMNLTSQDPCEWHFQLREPRGDGTASGTINVSTPTFRVSGSTNMKNRQINIVDYVPAGTDNKYVRSGVIPCVHNTTNNTISLSDLEIHIAIVSQPQLV